ncbi:hypothetical protein ACFLXO_06610 [Chloroflexota bacterium]
MENQAQKKTQSDHSILSKPLPEILDEISLAAADARKAADEARTAGERAAEEVMKRLRKLFLTMVKDITEELGEGKK